MIDPLPESSQRDWRFFAMASSTGAPQPLSEIDSKLKIARTKVFEGLWNHYFKLVPWAPQMVEAFKKRNDHWIEDHVAYRTLPGAHTGADVLQGIFEALGYTRQDNYTFVDKKLKAFWLAPPDIEGHSREASPKIFISELELPSFSKSFQETVSNYTSQVKNSPLEKIQKLAQDLRNHNADALPQLIQECTSYLTSPPAWARPSFGDFELLSRESEYAAWTLLYGPQINHFTVSVHLMESFSHIRQLADFLENELRIPMNKVGGVVKGQPELLLEQIATLAAKVPYPFQDGTRDVPYGFVEYAYRYPMAGKKTDGMWKSYYQGFVTSNADKIFESTFQGKN
jgi:hypothetical protein